MDEEAIQFDVMLLKYKRHMTNTITLTLKYSSFVQYWAWSSLQSQNLSYGCEMSLMAKNL